jgi:hypothetical protein
MDVTHIKWLSCPKEHFNYCKGKYHYPSLAFQAIVDHNRRILFLSTLYDGRENDKGITADDQFTYEIMNGKFNGIKYKLYTENGTLKMCMGGYIITDGGYQDIACFVDPMHNACGSKEVHWSEFLESVRKDVECCFGILKARFRILRNGLQYDRDTSNCIVKTCAIIHNMLLAFDGLDTFTWKEEDPEYDDDAIYWHNAAPQGDNTIVTRPDRYAAAIDDTTTPIGQTFKASKRVTF